MANEIDIELLRQAFSYDPDTGVVASLKTNKEAGYLNKRSTSKWPQEYRLICYKNKTYGTHRIAYALYFGVWPEVIDHIDGDTFNNKILNLRSVDYRDNRRNSSLSRKNKSGVSGVCWKSKENKWVSTISFLENGKRKWIHLIQTLDFFEAVCKRKSAEVYYGFHENHGRKNIYGEFKNE